MAFWKRFLLTMFVGALGGIGGIVICWLLMVYVLQYFILIIAPYLLFAMPCVGAFCAVRASALVNRFLDRYEGLDR